MQRIGRIQHSVFLVRAPIVPARQQTIPGWRTHRRRRVGIRETPSLFGQSIDIRGTNVCFIRSVAVETAVAEIVGKYEHDVWVLSGEAPRQRNSQQCNSECEKAFGHGTEHCRGQKL